MGTDTAVETVFETRDALVAKLRKSYTAAVEQYGEMPEEVISAVQGVADEMREFFGPGVTDETLIRSTVHTADILSGLLEDVGWMPFVREELISRLLTIVITGLALAGEDF